MRILFLTQIIPYPPDAGPKVKTWHVLRYLAEKGYEVILVSFVRSEEEKYVEALRRICSAVHTVPIRRSRLADLRYLLRSYLTKRPFLIERDDLFGMRRLVEKLVEENHINCIHADQLTMTQFAFKSRGFRNRTAVNREEKDDHLLKSNDGKSPKLIFDAHNAVWTIVERMYETMPAYLRPMIKGEAVKIKKYEGMVVQNYDHVMAVTEIDRNDLLEASELYLACNKGISPTDNEFKPTPISVVPIAVDTDKLKPIKRETGSMNILTLGTLHYPPNADGIRWFAREVFPLVQSRIPQATLTIIGKNPPQDLRQIGEESGGNIRITGYVPELDPYLEKSAMVVVPVRAGSGMRVRILDAFARAMPVVTTTVGLEGIEARLDKDVLVADSEEVFASKVVSLLQDQDMQGQLAMNGRKLATECYDWKIALSKMDEVYRELETGGHE
jgi:glycosyltransferase involved in cell wall biosynthesis